MLSPSLTRKILKVAGCGLIVAGIAACDRQSGGDKQPPEASASASSTAPDAEGAALDRSHSGSQLPSLTFKDAAGKEISTQSLKGKPVLINLWATWCGPCIAELPALNKLASGRKIRVLTVSQDSEAAKDKVAAFLKAKGGDALEPWLDPEGTAATQWQVTTLPASIYYDAQGREVWRINGGKDWAGAEAAKLLAE